MNDPALNNLLKWGIQNSEVSRNNATTTPKPLSESDRAALQTLISGGGPSDTELMVQSLDVVENNEAEPHAKHTAFENFEMLIQNIDNANTMENHQIWTRVIKQLDNDDPEIRTWAAWSCSTAVQNNIRAQERLLIVDGIPALVRLATTDSNRSVRKKATSALSSAVRNFQPGLDAVLSNMPAEYKPKEKLDANNMESVDILINKLREAI